jgi:hypothetical protein
MSTPSHNPLLGVFGAVGTWPNWERFFDPSRRGLILSFVALIFTLPMLWFVGSQIQIERGRLQGVEASRLNPISYIGILLAVGIAFIATASIIAILLRRMDRLPLWLIARNWAVFFLSTALAIIFAAVAYTPLPFAVANGALFAAYLGLLPIDIRLAQRAGGFPFMSAILIGCVVVSTSMMVLLSGVLLILQS